VCAAGLAGAPHGPGWPGARREGRGRRSSGTCLRALRGGGTTAIARDAGARMAGAWTSAGALAGRSGEAGEPLRAARAVGLTQVPAAEPERSAALADLKFQEQILHFESFSRTAVAQQPSSASEVERGGLWTWVRRHRQGKGALHGSCCAGFRHVVCVARHWLVPGRAVQYRSAMLKLYFLLHCSGKESYIFLH